MDIEERAVLKTKADKDLDKILPPIISTNLINMLEIKLEKIPDIINFEYVVDDYYYMEWNNNYYKYEENKNKLFRCKILQFEKSDRWIVFDIEFTGSKNNKYKHINNIENDEIVQIYRII